MKILDVSHHKGNIDWKKVKPNIDGAIIRLGYRGYSSGTIASDIKAWQNIKGCQDNNIPFSVYFFPCSINEAEALEEANWIANQIKGLNLSFPVFLDSEVADVRYKKGRADNLSASKRTQLLQILSGRLNTLGIKNGVYGSKSWLENQLIMSQLDDLLTEVWVAQYNTKCTYKGRYEMWQHTSKGEIDGITGTVDISERYVELNPAIRNDTSTNLKSIGQVAKDVIDGKYGINPSRKTRLTKEGYDASAVQKRVNEILAVQKKIDAENKTLASNEKSLKTYTDKVNASKNTLASLNDQLNKLMQ